MENSSKALLMAGGVLLALLVVSLLVFGYNSLTGYMSSDSVSKKEDQLAKFNAEYQAYERTGVRGNELLTLMNKIIDYNSRESSNSDIAYERMQIVVTIGDTSNFRYSGASASTYPIIVSSNYNNQTNDNQLLVISQAIQNINNATGYNFTDTQLQKLSNNISNIFVEEAGYTSTLLTQYQSSRQSLLKTILGKDVTDSSTPNIANVKYAAAEYYQFTKFKQAYFDFKSDSYNTKTGRITKLVFDFKGFYDS